MAAVHSFPSNILAILCLLCSFLDSQCIKSKDNKLILILLDGFRWDYFRSDHAGFQKMFKEGVKAEFLQPVFPSVSFTNYYSIATGLYAESHGMVHNFMYDKDKNKTFWIGGKKSDFESFWWEEADPIWITATRQHKDVRMYFWPGCEAEISGWKPAHCQPYTVVPSIANLSYAIDQTIDAFSKDEAQLSMIYVEMPDHVGHLKGPGDAELLTTIKAIDAEIHKMLQRLETTYMVDARGRMAEFVNVMLFSDHGMVPMISTINLTQIIDDSILIDHSDIDVYLQRQGVDTVAQVWPVQGKQQAVYQALKESHPNMSVYRKDNLPTRWHYGRNKRTSPVILVAREGYVIDYREDDHRNEPLCKGYHGYDPTRVLDMRGIFSAWGPGFKKGYKQRGLVNVELYQIMCHLLGLVPSPNNGSWSHVLEMLRSRDVLFEGHLTLREPMGMILLGTTVTCATAFLVIIIGMYVHRQYQRKQLGLNYTALVMNVPEHD